MLRGRPRLRIEILAQAAALVGLLVVFFLLVAQLRDNDSRQNVAPVAVVTSHAATPAPVLSSSVVLTPPPVVSVEPTRPLEDRVEKPRGAPRARGRAGADEAGPAEKLIRAYLLVLDPGDKPVSNVLVNARTARRRLRPRRTTKDGTVLLDGLPAREGPLDITVRDARWGKQRFTVRLDARQQTIKLRMPARAPLSGKVRTTSGEPPGHYVITLFGSDGTISELDQDVERYEDGSFVVQVVPDRYRVRAGAPGFCPSDFERTRVALNAAIQPVDLLLLHAGKISGTVVAPGGLRESKTVDIELELQARDGTLASFHKCRLGDDGHYEVADVRPGWYRARACDAKHDGTWTTYQVVEGGLIENATLFLDGERREPAFEGVVRDDADQPLPEVLVASRSKRVITDDTGRFLLRMGSDGSDPIEFTKEGYEPERRTPTREPGELDFRGVEVVLAPLD